MENRGDFHAERLDALGKEFEAFTYSISHDLRTPLRHIRGYADMLARGLGDGLEGKNAEYLSVILDSVHVLESRIEELLEYSRLTRTEMKPEAVDLGLLARECIGKLQPSVAERDVSWEVGSLPMVEADRFHLRQALSQILDNALKFTRTRSAARIEIGWAPEPAGRGVIHVRDNGVGFRSRNAGRLFGVFQRLHKSGDFEGKGMGLAKAGSIIRRHGGRIWAESEKDKGATFFFSLPLHQSGA